MIHVGAERLILQGRLWLQDAYIKIKEISGAEFTSDTDVPEADHFYLFGKENDDLVASPWWKDEDGNEHEIAETSAIITDHGALTGLLDDDHTQYLKEKASGGLAAEVPTHNHSAAGEAGTVDHGTTTGLTDDDHTQYVLRSILTTNGDLFTRAAGVIARLGIGSSGQVLTVTSGLPAWETPSSSGGESGGGHLHGLMRILGDGSTTTFNLLDLAEYLEHVALAGAIVDPNTFTLSADRSQITFDAAPGDANVITLEYVIAGL